MASGFIEHYITQNDTEDKYFTAINYVPSRAETINGGIIHSGAYAELNIKFKAKATASNSPQIGSVTSDLLPRIEISASCIDITNGISNAIESGVPAGIATDGKIYLKEIITDHIYALSCSYIADV